MINERPTYFEKTGITLDEMLETSFAHLPNAHDLNLKSVGPEESLLPKIPLYLDQDHMEKFGEKVLFFQFYRKKG